MLLPDRQDIRYPLGNMNPMAKPHIPNLLDQLIEMKVEEEIDDSLVLHHDDKHSDDSSLRLALVVVDDILGGWTDRIDVEFKNTFQLEPLLKRGWVEVIVWASEFCDSSDASELPPHVLDGIKETNKAKILLSAERSMYRALYHRQQKQQRNNGNEGLIQTLGDMLDQESWVHRQLQQSGLVKEETNGSSSSQGEGMEASLKTLKEHKNARIDKSFPTAIAAYYGNEAAERSGYPSLGMNSNWNGQRICASGQWNFDLI
ncbi:MAG: hypothetical protein SGBAC_007942 [Bacillariaceae sp.]